MTSGKVESAKQLTDLQMLDDLIAKTYEELEKNMLQNAKLGDFLKMIEMRHKLAPQKSAQNELWRMLDRIREENLPKDNIGQTAAAAAAGPEVSSGKPKTRKSRAAAGETK